tara:strand:+ start:95 stop:235 length:141 start_codon:yes stop_codon:yes gene_type:complete
MIYNFFISGSIDAYGPDAMIIVIMLIVIGIFLYVYSKKPITIGSLI